MTIYVLVEVTYDWHRFQKNIAVNDTGKFDKSLLKENYTLLEYEEYSKRYDALKDDQRCHYWIQKFEVED